MPFPTPRVAFAAALLGLPLAAAAQPGPPPTVPPVGTVAIDGTLTDAPYTLLGTNAGGPAPSFSGGNQLTSLRAYVDTATNTLFLGIGGNIDNNNRLVVFVDSRAGGYGNGDFGAAGPGGVSNFNTAHTFDAGFTADFAIAIGTDGTRSDYYVNVVELGGTRAVGASTDRYLGSANTSNAPGSDVAAAVTADPANTTSGFELQIPLGATASASTLIARDRQSVQFFAVVTGDSGFLSNSFLSPAPAAQTANYGTAVLNFETLQQDPLSYVFQPVAGRKGWRQLAWPVQGGTVGNYAIQNFVQGPGTNFPAGASNVILQYNSSGNTYQYATALANPLESGRGQFWYHYDAADFPGGTPPPGSNFQARPYTLRAGGIEPQANVVVNAGEVSTTGFMMAGNPFSLDFDTQGITQVSGSSTVVGPLVYVWDPDAGATGAYVVIDRNAAVQADRTVAPMQGMWIESRVSAPAFAGVNFAPQFAQASRVQGNEPIVSRSVAQRVLGFELSRLTDAGPALEWPAARLAFVDGAGEGSDAFDGGLPPALDAASDVRIAFVGADGEFRGQESRAFALAGAVEARLALLVAGRPAGAAYRLTWPSAADVPADWAVTLLDGDSGETVDLRVADHYDFTASSGPWAERFTVRVALRSTAGEGTPAVTRLGAARPNPAVGGTRLALTVDQPQHVRAALYDALGRSVAVVFDGAVERERDLAVDTRALAPGIYVLRVSGDTFAESRQITVAR